MKFELVIEADTNDADYVNSIHTVTQEDIDRLIPILKVIKDNHGTWKNGDKGNPEDIYPDMSEADIEFFEVYTPYGEYGIHTIESVFYYPLPEKVRLL